MLKAVATLTCLIILVTYLILLALMYPYVCWIKYHPSDNYPSREFPPERIIQKRLGNPCSSPRLLHLMPMPSTVIVAKSPRLIRLPSTVRLESTRSLPTAIINSSSAASFVLTVDYQTGNESHSYPYHGVDESYQLNITSDARAYLLAQTFVGVIRGLSTFEQLQRHEQIPIPLSIVDEPRFTWRGLMLDTARHFIPIATVKQTIDLMRLVKMNVLHLHLSDDQGFRLESKRFPLLHDRHEFYTQAEIKDLIDYARRRAVRIVPEFDMPAHTSSWFVGYPSLASSQQQSYAAETAWGVLNATMDVSRPSTYEFLDGFFREVTQLFPDRYVHIGGDECVPYEWLQSERVQAFMQEKHLLDQKSLQGYFTRRIETLLKKYNRVIVGWDEISTSRLSRSVIIQSWRHRRSLFDAVHRGYRAILSHGFYLDHMSSAGYHYATDLRLLVPTSDEEQRRVIGGEACLWTEYISSAMVHSRLWPRTAAIAERFWSSESDQIECMYDRLAVIDRRYFHPDDRAYLRDLSRLANSDRALKLLADLCEPLGLSGRDQTRNYTSRTPLNRFVDLLRPESEQTRLLIKTNNISLLHSAFLAWIRNQPYLKSNDSDILQLSSHLAQLGRMGLRLLQLFDETQPPRIVPLRWYYYQVYLLNTYEYDVPEIRLAGVRILRDLLEHCDPCAFDVIDLALLLFFPVIVIFLHTSFLRRRCVSPCLSRWYVHHACASSK